MTEENGNRRDRLTLSPPTFSLPENMDDYELWTVRLPTSLDIAALHDVELDIEKMGTFQADNVEYGMTYGHAVENEHFRLLVRNDSGYLHLHNRPFDRHVNVVDASSLVETVDAELAPRVEMAPPPVDPVRISYSHIPQASGLKRRWMPPGVSTSATYTVISKRSSEHEVALDAPALIATNGSMPSSADAQTSKRARDEETSMMNGSDAKKLSKKEKKAMKKAEKKAKKERKREKKEKKRKRES